MEQRPDRFTALLDASVLVPVALRNILLSLAESGMFRPRWSSRILDETEAAITKLIGCAETAARQRHCIEYAFREARVEDWTHLVKAFGDAPDPNDAHVMAAAAQCGAHVIVTDNLRHFPLSVLAPWDLSALSADTFIADLIDLDQQRAVVALSQMRARLKRPEIDAERLLVRMERCNLNESTQLLRPHLAQL